MQKLDKETNMLNQYGLGQDLTCDLTIFSRSLVPTALPSLKVLINTSSFYVAFKAFANFTPAALYCGTARPTTGFHPLLPSIKAMTLTPGLWGRTRHDNFARHGTCYQIVFIGEKKPRVEPLTREYCGNRIRVGP